MHSDSCDNRFPDRTAYQEFKLIFHVFEPRFKLVSVATRQAWIQRTAVPARQVFPATGTTDPNRQAAACV